MNLFKKTIVCSLLLVFPSTTHYKFRIKIKTPLTNSQIFQSNLIGYPIPENKAG